VKVVSLAIEIKKIPRGDGKYSSVISSFIVDIKKIPKGDGKRYSLVGSVGFGSSS